MLLEKIGFDKDCKNTLATSELPLLPSFCSTVYVYVLSMVSAFVASKYKIAKRKRNMGNRNAYIAGALVVNHNRNVFTCPSLEMEKFPI